MLTLKEWQNAMSETPASDTTTWNSIYTKIALSYTNQYLEGFKLWEKKDVADYAIPLCHSYFEYLTGGCEDGALKRVQEIQNLIKRVYKIDMQDFYSSQHGY